MERYNRNRIYVSEDEQEKVRETRILLGGAGIGSIIAECALRFGFENIVIVDGDRGGAIQSQPSELCQERHREIQGGMPRQEAAEDKPEGQYPIP